MMAHMSSPAQLVVQAKLMESYGANCIYITDSAGHMLPDDVTARISQVRDALKPETELGFHGHHNLAMGVANSVAAVAAGANRIDAAAAGLGAGAGNTPMEVFVAVCDRMGIETGVDVFAISDVAEDLVVPIMDAPIRLDRDALTLGYAGVYSSFLLFAKRGSEVRDSRARHPRRAGAAAARRRAGGHDRGCGTDDGAGAGGGGLNERGRHSSGSGGKRRETGRGCVFISDARIESLDHASPADFSDASRRAACADALHAPATATASAPRCIAAPARASRSR